MFSISEEHSMRSTLGPSYGMVVGFTTTCAISAYHHQRCEFDSRSWRDVFDTTLCDKFVYDL